MLHQCSPMFQRHLHQTLPPHPQRQIHQKRPPTPPPRSPQCHPRRNQLRLLYWPQPRRIPNRERKLNQNQNQRRDQRRNQRMGHRGRMQTRIVSALRGPENILLTARPILMPVFVSEVINNAHDSASSMDRVNVQNHAKNLTGHQAQYICLKYVTQHKVVSMVK